MHPLQSQAWGVFRKAMGIDVVQMHDWIITFHSIPHTPYTIGYFPKGPLPDEKMIDELRKLGKQKNAIFIQIEPNEQNKKINLPYSHHPLFTKYTFILDLTKSEEELLKNMQSKTRYNIKVAQKHGVKINETDAIDKFIKLSHETSIRQGFYAHNETYQRTMWDTMHKAGIAHLFTATYKEKVLAAWIVFAYGDTLYYPYGASSRDNRETMAPTLMLWEIALWGKKKGLKKFDLWGAMGPEPDINDPFYGFHRFKQGFNPDLVEFVGSYDLILNNPLYFLYKIADFIRWKL